MPATGCEPGDGLHLIHTFTCITDIAPPSQILAVSFPLLLPALRQELRSVRPLVRAREIAVKRILQIHPGVDAACGQIVQPYLSWSF